PAALAREYVHAIPDIRVEPSSAFCLSRLQDEIVHRLVVVPRVTIAVTGKAELERSGVRVVNGDVDLDLVRAAEQVGKHQQAVLVVVGSGLPTEAKRQLLIVDE